MGAGEFEFIMRRGREIGVIFLGIGFSFGLGSFCE